MNACRLQLKTPYCRFNKFGKYSNLIEFSNEAMPGRGRGIGWVAVVPQRGGVAHKLTGAIWGFPLGWSGRAHIPAGVVSSHHAAIQKDRGTGPDDVLATYHE